MASTPTTTPVAPVLAEPAPLGLIGLAVGCAALTPMAFGAGLTPESLKTAAMFCLLFGCGGQLLAGLMSFVNKNLMGGTLFTAFSFNWAMNAWALFELAQGRAIGAPVVLAVDVAFLVTFAVLTLGFGFFSKLLFAFLLVIDALYVFKIMKELTGFPMLSWAVAACTVALGALSLWLAFAGLINPTAGRAVFPMPGPLFVAVQQKDPTGSLVNPSSEAARAA